MIKTIKLIDDTIEFFRIEPNKEISEDEDYEITYYNVIEAETKNYQVASAFVASYDALKEEELIIILEEMENTQNMTLQQFIRNLELKINYFFQGY